MNRAVPCVFNEGDGSFKERNPTVDNKTIDQSEPARTDCDIGKIGSAVYSATNGEFALATPRDDEIVSIAF